MPAVMLPTAKRKGGYFSYATRGCQEGTLLHADQLLFNGGDALSMGRCTGLRPFSDAETGAGQGGARVTVCCGGAPGVT